MDLCDPAFSVDDDCDSVGVACFGVRAGTIRLPDFPIRVAEERERELEFLGEVRVLFDRVEADPENLDFEGSVGAEMVAEPATLNRSARRVGLRVEPQDDALPPVVLQLSFLARVVQYLEIGSLLANSQHDAPPCALDDAWTRHRGQWRRGQPCMRKRPVA